MEDIVKDNFDLSIDGKDLLKYTQLKIIYKYKYGLIGRNGAGKSTLLKYIAQLKKNGSILYIDQDVDDSDDTVIDLILNTNKDRMNDINEINDLMTKDDMSFDELERYNTLSDRVGV